MADESPDVRCFQLTIYLSSDNPVVGPTFFAAAGNNHDEVIQQPPRFQTSELMHGKTVCSQLLKKLGKAVDAGSETVRIRVGNTGIIVPDPEAAAPPPFYLVSLTFDATLPLADNDKVVLVELALDKPIPNDSGSMVVFDSVSNASAPTGAPEATDRFSFVPYVGPANEQPAQTSCLRFKIKKEAASAFIQQIKEKPNARVFLIHNQP
jgi:hypothetical protein